MTDLERLGRHVGEVRKLEPRRGACPKCNRIWRINRECVFCAKDHGRAA